jgi:deoxyribonuclease-1
MKSKYWKSPFLKYGIAGLVLLGYLVLQGPGYHIGIPSDNTVPHPLTSFREAKAEARHIFSDHRRTFYCGCKFDKHNKVDLKSCGYKVQEDKRRAHRLEWEHIVPISHLAAHLPCWKKPLCSNKRGEFYRGRRCCQEQDAVFNKMEADLHNLVPELGELNGLRSNYRFGLLPEMEPGQFGECQIKIDSQRRRVEPREAIRGVIARTHLYMVDTYHLELSDSQRKLFRAWNAKYAPSDWEIEWDERIFRIQGNHNRYISHYVEHRDHG